MCSYKVFKLRCAKNISNFPSLNKYLSQLETDSREQSLDFVSAECFQKLTGVNEATVQETAYARQCQFTELHGSSVGGKTLPVRK